MSDNPQADYMAFKQLKSSYGYELLEVEWLHQITKIEEERDKAAKKGNETSWRYWAGRESGAKLMMTALERAMKNIEATLEGPGKSTVDKLLEEIKQ